MLSDIPTLGYLFEKDLIVRASFALFTYFGSLILKDIFRLRFFRLVRYSASFILFL